MSAPLVGANTAPLHRAFAALCLYGVGGLLKNPPLPHRDGVGGILKNHQVIHRDACRDCRDCWLDPVVNSRLTLQVFSVLQTTSEISSPLVNVHVDALRAHLECVLRHRRNIWTCAM